jgi:S1-C subfamily serine protease
LVPALAVAAAIVGPAAEARAGEGALAALEAEQQRLFDRIAPAVVFVEVGNAFGTGFAVGPDLVLTNAHVAGEGKRVTLVLPGGKQVDATVVERGKDDVDLALLSVAGAGLPALHLGGRALRVGAWVGAVGHGRGGIWSFNTGMVTNIYPLGTERPVFQTQIPLNPGNSGGPIFDRNGDVVGIATAGITDANAINFAIRATVACRALARMRALCDLLTVRAPRGVAIFVDGRYVGVGPEVQVPAEDKAYEVFAVVAGKMRQRKVRYPETKLVDLGQP